MAVNNDELDPWADNGPSPDRQAQLDAMAQHPDSAALQTAVNQGTWDPGPNMPAQWTNPDTPDPGPSSNNVNGSGGNGNGSGGGRDFAAEAKALNEKLGLKDSGNLDSLLAGRASWDEYVKDETARANNYTGDRLYDSQDKTKYDSNGKYIGPPVSSAPGAQTAALQKYTGLMSQISSSPDPMQAAVARDKMARQVFDDLEAAGHDVSWKNDELVVDGRRYVVGGNTADTKYTPGEIGTSDIPNLGVDAWFDKASAQTPVENLADKVVTDVLNDPFGGFDETYAGNLKAQAKDTSADTYLQEQAGIDDAAHQLGQDATISPWAQSEKLASRRSRDLGLAGINTGIDISVQDKRAASRQSTAAIATTYAGQKANQRQSALTLASDNVFKQAALNSDRMTLRETVKQKAAELGIQTDQMMNDYIVSKQKELTSRLGLRLGYDIDTAKLEQSSQQFKEDLMMRLQQLEEASRQFSSQYDLDLADLQFRQDNEAWRRANG